MAMPSLKKNDLYKKVHPNFGKSGFQESLATVQGFVLGLLARGHTPSDSKTLELATTILNSGEPLTGSGIALFTTMLIEEERLLKVGLETRELGLFVPSAKEAPLKDRLQAMVDLAYGFNLGLCGESKPVIGSIADPDFHEINANLDEYIYNINAFSSVDTDDDASEADFAELLALLKDMILTVYLMIKL